jgi:hypothetical protein
MFLSWKLKYDEEEGILHKYIAVFIFFQMLLATITIGLQGLSYGHEIVAGVQLVYLVVLIVMRPYYLPSQNVMLVACQFVSLAFLYFLSDTRLRFAVGYNNHIRGAGFRGSPDSCWSNSYNKTVLPLEVQHVGL